MDSSRNHETGDRNDGVQAVNQHDAAAQDALPTRREWWVVANSIFPSRAYTSKEDCDRHSGLKSVHVREVLPGEITITPEEFVEAWDRAVKNSTATRFPEAIFEELFGPLRPEGTHDNQNEPIRGEGK